MSEPKKIECPNCTSKCVRGRIKTKDYVCIRCGNVFKS